MEREVLRSLLHDHVALDVAFGDRKVDREPRDLDAIPVADGTDRLRRRCARARGTAWGRADRRHGQRSEGVRVWPLSHRDQRDSERNDEPTGKRDEPTWHTAILRVQDECRPNERASRIDVLALPR